eukprot:scaffold131467_cov85-Attheya_sp.AAC.4
MAGLFYLLWSRKIPPFLVGVSWVYRWHPVRVRSNRKLLDSAIQYFQEGSSSTSFQGPKGSFVITFLVQ